jgi:hypothetical protein
LFSFVNLIVSANALLLLIISWIAGSKASRLRFGGSAERLSRKARKQMVWAAYATLPAAAMIAVTFLVPESTSPAFWEERMLLHLPLTVLPLLATWFLSMPRLWKLWRAACTTTGAPLPVDIRKQAAHPMLIVPFQMSVLGSVAVFYYLFVTTVPLHLVRAVIPILVWVAGSALLWFAHQRRWRRVGHPETPLLYQP